MAAAPDDARQRHEEALAAALLLLGRRYDLPGLVRAARARPRPFRRIEPTEALRSAMARPYLDLVRAWAAERPALVAAYADALRSGDAATISRRIDAIAKEIEARAEASFAAPVAQLERWHRAQWNRRVASATGLDVSLLTTPAEVAPDASAAKAWNEQLHADVHRQIGAGVAAAFMVAFALRKPAEEAEADIAPVLRRARTRGLNIGVDQVDRASRAFDRARRVAAGLGSFRWHHTEQRHPRPEHLARDGRVYTEASAPNDRAGTLPNCKCWEEALWD